MLQMFLKEWTNYDSQEAKVIKAIEKFIRENKSDILFKKTEQIEWRPDLESIEDFLGLPYTSSSNHAGLWVCNVNMYYQHFDVQGFVIAGKDSVLEGEVFAEMQDQNEDTYYLQIS